MSSNISKRSADTHSSVSQAPLSLNTQRHDFERALREAPDLETRVSYISNFQSGKTAFATSLGLEDQAILHAISVSGAKIDVFTLDTGRHFPETLDTLEISERRYGLRIRVISPDHHDVEQFTAREGINGFRLSIEARKARAPPEVFGLGVITLIPALARSGQSLISLGLPLRTRNTIVDV